MAGFSIHNAWKQLNVVADQYLRSKDDELPAGVHPDRSVDINQLQNAWAAGKGSAVTKAKIQDAYAAGDRSAARQAWGSLLTEVYPVLREPPKTGFSQRTK